MQLQDFLNSKGYNFRTMSINGQFNLIVMKENKIILRLNCPPQRISREEFNIKLTETVINLYEENLNESKTDEDNNNKSETVCCSATEPIKEC
jgi:hypothetical protein